MDFLGKLFGPLTDLMGGALEAFHALGAPWWLSIALLTVSVRALLFPLTAKQVKNVRAMQELKPEMDGIRSRYEDDRSKQQEAMMELYKERRVNPLAGFLPVLVQIPVFIIMYRVIRLHEETFPGFANGGLLWFDDLTRADPYFILPIISAAVLVAAGKVSSRNVVPTQRRTMLLLPVAFTAFIARFPAGLFVYWITSNAVTLVQNCLIYRCGPDHASPQSSTETLASPPSGRPAQATSRGGSEPANKSSDRKAKKRDGRRRKKKKRKR